MNALGEHILAVGPIAALIGMSGVSAARADAGDVRYQAMLHPMNAAVVGSEAKGRATFTISGDELTIHIEVEDAPPGIEHWQHFHGFATGDAAAKCPTDAADANHDGIIDLIETELSAGTTMVPFNADPVAMDIPASTYPKADAHGDYTYQTTVSMKALEAAFAKKFPGQRLGLDRRVVFVHGAPDDANLPATVASLDDIPAHVTLPIACGVIEKAGAATPAASPRATSRA